MKEKLLVMLNHNPDLLKIAEALRADGYDVRVVGGAVRDIMTDVEPKDIDLCTDAFPDEMLAAFSRAGIRTEPTGLQHGTITAVMAHGAYEITSLRTESEHDGRYAKMTFTRDWVEDLSRRDLTFNAMAMTFDGDLIDPFGGYADLRAGKVRFVGDAAERMREDYLRILRFFRFYGRVTDGSSPIDPETSEAIKVSAPGLQGISAERVWSETKKILAADSGVRVYIKMFHHNVINQCSLPEGNTTLFTEMVSVAEFTKNPVSRLCVLLQDGPHVVNVARALKWSTDETKLAHKIVALRNRNMDDLMRAVIVEGIDAASVAEVCRYQGMPFMAAHFESMVVPVFPVNGDDLKNAGVAPGKGMGDMMKSLKQAWFADGCAASKADLLATIAV